MTDKKLAEKIRKLVAEYMEENYPEEYRVEKVDDDKAWEVVYETVIR